MAEFTVHPLLSTGSLKLVDVRCRGECRHKSLEECAGATQLVFPYRGVFMRHVGAQSVVAEANQVVFFNADEAYSVSHPVSGGDDCLSLSIDEALLAELMPADQTRQSGKLAFNALRRRIDPRAQALVALLRHRLLKGPVEALEAEILILTLVKRSLGDRSSHAAGASAGRRKLVDRAKLVLASDLARRWTLAEIAAETGVSPVYLTQVFQQVEAMPLYRYQLRLRLASALAQLGETEDLTDLGLSLGFSSHSHFTAAFRQTYGRTPSEIRASLR